MKVTLRNSKLVFSSIVNLYNKENKPGWIAAVSSGTALSAALNPSTTGQTWSDYIPVEGGKKLTIDYQVSCGSHYFVILDSDKNVINGEDYSVTAMRMQSIMQSISKTTITLPANAAYIAFTVNIGTVNLTDIARIFYAE